MALSATFRERIVMSTISLVVWQLEVLGEADDQTGLIVDYVNDLIQSSRKRIEALSPGLKRLEAEQEHYALLIRLQNLADDAELIGYLALVVQTAAKRGK